MIDQLRECLLTEEDILAAYLIGSVARGEERPDSDLDIALLLFPQTKLPARNRLQLATDLSMIARREIDLGLLSTRNLIYTMQAIENGRLIFIRDSNLLDAFVATVFSQYARYREDRQPIDRAYNNTSIPS